MIATVPLKTDYRDRTFPSVTVGLIAVNIVVFLCEIALGDTFVLNFSAVPCEILATCPVPGGVIPYLTLFTSMFLHGGLLHLVGNMLYLWVFGQNVEDAMGHAYYLGFYLVCGLLANLAQIALSPASTVPGLGASGAIAGVLGAYLVLFPWTGVRTLVRVGFLVVVPRIPAVVLLGLWFGLQLLSEVASLGTTTEEGGVAYAAHVGGFLAGFAWAWWWRGHHLPTMIGVRA